MDIHKIHGDASEQDWWPLALAAVVLLAVGLTLIDLTRSGYGNAYYATGALAASHSWSALFNNAADLGGYVSLDKGPLPDWLQGLSGRVFGFGPFSVMFPEALYAIATVVVLYDTVRRALGRQIAILAALTMALTPVAVLVGRYNTPDALLLLLLVCATWSLTVAIQAGRPRELLLCGALVGLAFNTKMLEAYLVLPAFALAYLMAASRSLRRRGAELALAAGVALLVSFAWFGSMMLVPAGDRPYVGDTTENSWFQLIFEGNGIQRVAGSSGAFARHLESNLLYLSSARLAGQIAWLLPLALVGLLLGLFTTWCSRREDFAFGSYVLWGTWALLGCAVLSFSAGARHAYYTSVLAPAVATLAAAGLMTLWRLARASPLAAGGLALALACGTGVSYAVLLDSAEFLPWLKWVVLACGAVAAIAVLVPHLHAMPRGRRRIAATVSAIAGGAATIALLAGPAAYSLATVTHEHVGYDPTAGPSLSGSESSVAASGSDLVATGLSFPKPLSSAARSAETVALLVPYLEANQGDARFLVAATDATTADAFALATGRAVITIGGFSGADPTPTVGQIKQLIGSGQLRYVVLDAARVMPKSALQRALSGPTWVERHCVRVPETSIVPASLSSTQKPGSRLASELTLFVCAPAV
jgi:4-amino-4-deoxy-L-arabinose transferase-like glycosyltransferase